MFAQGSLLAITAKFLFWYGLRILKGIVILWWTKNPADLLATCSDAVATVINFFSHRGEPVAASIAHGEAIGRIDEKVAEAAVKASPKI